MFGFGKKPPLLLVSAVIVVTGGEGAGSGREQGLDLPVAVRAVAAFEACRRVHEIVLVCPRDQIADYYYMVQEYGFSKVASVVGGGENRQESVFLGVNACSADTHYLAIHAEARPLVDPLDIEHCLEAAIANGAAAVGVPAKDTIKICNAQGFIVSSPDRSGLYIMQAPGIFEASLYRRAMAAAIREGKVYADDCQMVERCGAKVCISPGSYQNIKISDFQDLALADAILRFQEEGAEQWQASV